MAIVVVLFPISGDEPRLEPTGLERLAKLGVTNVALVRDPSGAGLVLEGWAFDARDALRAVGAVVGATEGVRTLEPLVEMAVSSAAIRDGEGEE